MKSTVSGWQEVWRGSGSHLTTALHPAYPCGLVHCEHMVHHGLAHHFRFPRCCSHLATFMFTLMPLSPLSYRCPSQPPQARSLVGCQPGNQLRSQDQAREEALGLQPGEGFGAAPDTGLRNQGGAREAALRMQQPGGDGGRGWPTDTFRDPSPKGFGALPRPPFRQ